MTTQEQLRVLEDEPGPPPPSAASRWVLAGAAALLLALIAVIPGNSQVSGTSSVEPIEEAPTAPALNRASETAPEAMVAVDIAERLIVAVNRADSEAVIDLLAQTVPHSGLGSSEWPTLHGDVGWWGDTLAGTMLDEGSVTDFVRYFRTMPGGVVSDGCVAVPPGDTRGVVRVDCEFWAFGGIRGVMGDRTNTESGQLSVLVADGMVVDVTQASVLNALAWNQLGMWLAATDPSAFDDLFRKDGGWLFRPEYNGVTAVRHAEAAAAFADAIGAESLPIG